MCHTKLRISTHCSACQDYETHTMSVLKNMPRCVVFDLDGTLIDTGPDLTAATNHVLALAGRPSVTVAEVRDMVGLGARKLIERGLAHTGGGTLEQAESLLQPFLDYYADNICVGSQPFPGVEQTLTRLQDAGILLGICTNKPEGLSHALIEALGWQRFFPVNVGGDSLPYRKPDGRHILKVVERLGGNPLEAVMVGDSAVDVGAARDAGLPVVAVSFGFSSVPAAELGADALIDHFDQLIDALAAVQQGRAAA